MGLRATASAAGSRLVVVPLGIFLASRVFSTLVLLAGSGRQVALVSSPAAHVEVPLPADPGYWGLVTNWDGQWYQTIALHGYPTDLPATGQLSQTPWAFYPGFPMLARAVMWSTGLAFPVAASLVSLVAAGIGMCLLYRLLERHANPFVAAATVACLSTFVTGVLWQVAYSEGLALLLLTGALLALSQRRLGLVLACGVGLALTRPITPALVAVVLADLAWRWHQRRRRPIRPSEAVGQLAVAGALAAATFIWPLTSAVLTGRGTAYLDTMQAWPTYRGGILSGGAVGGLAADGNWGAAGAIVALAAVLVVIVARPQAALWGPLRAWALAYPAFILVVNGPSASLARYAMLAIAPLFPLPEPQPEPQPDPTAPPRQAGRVTASRQQWAVLTALVILGLACQYFWTREVFIVHEPGAVQVYP